ncbi:hypothetical protein F5883DRAFT_400793 [Diaporthe sp. PMI_573]|nr:hypothetical protein F5883DRAFT_400793 [Diaporthaceae sp. PMI_573]
MAVDNLQPLAYAVASVMFAIGTISFFLRFYCRAIVKNAFGWDDVLSVFLLLVNTMQQVVLYMFLHYGCGLHASTLTPYQLEKITLWLFVEELWYMVTHWTIKMTFLIFYIRLSPNRKFRITCFATMGLNTAFMIINWLLALLQCIPLDAYFHPEAHPDAKCIDKGVLLLGPSILNVITDVIILVLPIRTVWNLNMSRRKKIAVTGVLGFGASSVVVAACRFIVLAELGSTQDPSYVLGNMVIVAAFEIQLAIVAVNLPAMKALYSGMTGGSTNDHSIPIIDSNGYELSSMEAKGKKMRSASSRKNPAAPVADVSITRHMASESEEELWQQENRGKVQVTRTVEVNSFQSETESEAIRKGSPEHPYAKDWA